MRKGARRLIRSSVRSAGPLGDPIEDLPVRVRGVEAEPVDLDGGHAVELVLQRRSVALAEHRRHRLRRQGLANDIELLVHEQVARRQHRHLHRGQHHVGAGVLAGPAGRRQVATVYDGRSSPASLASCSGSIAASTNATGQRRRGSDEWMASGTSRASFDESGAPRPGRLRDHSGGPRRARRLARAAAERSGGFRDDLFLKALAADRSPDDQALPGVLTAQRTYLLRELRDLAELRRSRGAQGDHGVVRLLITAAELQLRAQVQFLDVVEEELLASRAERHRDQAGSWPSGETGFWSGGGGSGSTERWVAPANGPSE